MMFEYTSFTRRAPAPGSKRHTLFYTKKSVDDGHDDHIFWTDDGGIGFNISGHVIIKTAEEWHALAKPAVPLKSAPALGKCPDCYGEGTMRCLGSPCRLCKGSGLVQDEVLAQREAEYHAWLKRRVAKKPRGK